MRERIIAALTELSHTRGFYNVTMDELASQAGMSKRTVYRYFSGKEEIIEAVLDEFMASVAGGIESIVNEEKSIADMVARLAKHFTKTGGRLLNPLVLNDLQVHYPHFWQKIERFRAEKIEFLIKQAMAKQDLARDIHPQVFITAFIASVQAVINPRFILDHGLTLDGAVHQLVELFSYGLVGRNDTG
ncbi:TetR/AcrR family transcriptional regulator [Desulfallas thermosapovorans]|uniref:TetR family transcriptional regulator n=1 Tax=Desulfallas thermosapovorans DSM 6562 TaxID=1121431 RepID=A0A5S4ZRB4_9FIRM|nr:TetR/AcrR family transcriptional regulator [Desulfallas thermosapovorans]TYO95269.1 TetR family transcriptional regulator [Desulfallas thermosapovorans DSM 6562]